MKAIKTFQAAALCLGLGTMLAAQEGQPSAEAVAIMKAMTPGIQHAYLADQVGTWTATASIWMDPSAPPIQSVGTVERTLILGGRVLKETYKAEFMGMPYEAISHTGYDNVTGRYWSTSFDNISTGLTTLEGTMDEATGKGTLEGVTSGSMAAKTVPIRIEIHREEGKVIFAYYLTGPGAEIGKTMEIVYERVSSGWVCGNHDPRHAALTTVEVENCTKKHGCTGWKAAQ